MKIKEIMTRHTVTVGAEESVEVAARTLTQYNIGALPVCASDGRLCGMLTDRDLVTRCMASGKPPDAIKVKDVMTGAVTCVDGEMDVSLAARLMGRQQIRRLPVLQEGKICGMLSLADLARWEETAQDAADALENISENLR